MECTYPPPNFTCPSAEFTALESGTYQVAVAMFGGQCVDLNTGEYSIIVDAPSDPGLTLVQDNAPQYAVESSTSLDVSRRSAQPLTDAARRGLVQPSELRRGQTRHAPRGRRHLRVAKTRAKKTAGSASRCASGGGAPPKTPLVHGCATCALVNYRFTQVRNIESQLTRTTPPSSTVTVPRWADSSPGKAAQMV